MPSDDIKRSLNSADEYSLFYIKRKENPDYRHFNLANTH
ncbi:hypothetical protein L3N51_01872 [Metallosphaera sp. J1]|nr:hypothetical protein [Metallosphaera javensis (ex Hofmann et al. 2022)]